MTRAAETRPQSPAPPLAQGREQLLGAPFVPAEAGAELIALKGATAFLCTRPDGEIAAAGTSGEGFYYHDTRHLSELRLSLGGHQPVLLSSVIESGQEAEINQTNPWFTDADGRDTPQETINLRRTLVLLEDRLFVRIRLRSYCRHPVTVPLALTVAADFADVFEVRSGKRQVPGELLTPTYLQGSGALRYRAPDGFVRETLLQLSPEPSAYTTDGGARLQFAWSVYLTAGDSFHLELTARPFGPRRRPFALARGVQRQQPTAAEAVRRVKRRRERWLGGCTKVESGNELFSRFIAASLRDLQALMMPAAGGELPAAGIPWYVAPFGRDSLVTGLQTLLVNPRIAQGTLMVLANMQSQVDDAYRDAEPGKIPHELRSGELARRHQIPHTPYYGTVDATPLFVLLSTSYYRWTLDRRTIEELLPALEAALKWVDVWGDRDGDGFVEYLRRSPAGLLNQGWKDSEDSVLHPDGQPAEGPIALAEVQGYVYAAKLQVADLYEQLGYQHRGRELRHQAERLRAAFNEAFWDADQKYFALALDGNKEQVRTITSNPAHCLFCGIVDEEKAPFVAKRLLSPELFSGWGIRTVSAEMEIYNPMSYHNGSVWPHDNAIAAAGLKRYGFHEEAATIAKAIFDVGLASPNLRLPELLCGFARGDSAHYVSYPVACSPQAWAAGAPIMLLESLLGLHADAAGGRLLIDEPYLPEWLDSLELRELRVGPAKVTLSFRRTSGGNTAFSLLDQEGELGVTMAASPNPWTPRSSGPSSRPSRIR